MTIRKRSALLLSILCIAVSSLYAQTISGTVIDAISKSPVVNAKITVLENKKEYKTDATGSYKIDSLEKGDYSIRFEAESYIKQTKSVKMVAAQGNVGTTSITLNVVLFSVSSEADQAKGSMEIKYYFPGHNEVSIDVCDANDKIVKTVFDRSRNGGMRTFLWNGADNKGVPVPAGKYTCKFKCGNLYTSRTLVWNGEQKK